MIGLIIAAVLEIIAITATATTTGVALQQSIQTVDFVNNWYSYLSKSWSTQRQIDSEINAQLTDLQQAVIMLGDQIVSLQHQISMKCDWNTTGFCVTPVPYNHTYFPWTNVKRHLLNHGTMTQERLDLQQHIPDTFQEQLQVLSGSNLL